MTDRPRPPRGGLLLLPLLGAAACVPAEIDERDMPRRIGQAMCAQERRCAKGAWLNQYYGQADCIATWEEVLQDLVDLYDDLDCDYSRREAGDTYADLSSMDCEAFYEDVYTDPTLSALDDIWDLQDCGIFANTSFPPGSLP